MRRYAGKLLIGALLAAGTLWAQEPERGPDGSSKSTVPGVTILPVVGKPFSGVDNIEWTRTGEDGTTVTKHLQAVLARDSFGRIYREHHTFVAASSQDPAPMKYIHIADPITRTQMTCYLQTFVCNLYDYTPDATAHVATIGSIDNGAKYRTRESLGKDEYMGFDVMKSKEVTTTRAGAEGNDRDLIETREFWYCEALQTNLKIVRSEPLAGKQTVYITGISLSEPNPDWFRIPLGYKVHDVRHVRSPHYGNR